MTAPTPDERDKAMAELQRLLNAAINTVSSSTVADIVQAQAVDVLTVLLTQLGYGEVVYVFRKIIGSIPPKLRWDDPNKISKGDR
jgi:hypothetical protein